MPEKRPKDMTQEELDNLPEIVGFKTIPVSELPEEERQKYPPGITLQIPVVAELQVTHYEKDDIAVFMGSDGASYQPVYCKDGWYKRPLNF